jgi:hypothetical protein
MAWKLDMSRRFGRRVIVLSDAECNRVRSRHGGERGLLEEDDLRNPGGGTFEPKNRLQ